MIIIENAILTKKLLTIILAGVVTIGGSSAVTAVVVKDQVKKEIASEVSLKGEKGDKGNTGEMGPQGAEGLEGPIGKTGATGPVGKVGATGIMGLTGLMGPTGPAGSKGEQGLVGLTGEKGEVGPIGPKGESGAGFTVYNEAEASKYLKGEIIYYKNKLYRVNVSSPTGVPGTGSAYIEARLLTEKEYTDIKNGIANSEKHIGEIITELAKVREDAIAAKAEAQRANQRIDNMATGP